MKIIAREISIRLFSLFGLAISHHSPCTEMKLCIEKSDDLFEFKQSARQGQRFARPLGKIEKY